MNISKSEYEALLILILWLFDKGQTAVTCEYSAKSMGYSDTDGHRTANFRVNGDFIAGYNIDKGQRIREDDLPIGRGLNIIEVKVNKTHCSAVTARNFDTYGSDSNVQAMISFLNGLPRGDTVYFGLSADTAVADISPRNLGADALHALRENFAVDLETLGFRGSVAFVARKGDPSFARQIIAANGNGPARLRARISYDRVQKVRSNEQLVGASGALYNTVPGAPTHRMCCHLCNLDDDCCVAGARQDGPANWTCHLYGQLPVDLVEDDTSFVASPGYYVYQAQYHMGAIDMWSWW